MCVIPGRLPNGLHLLRDRYLIPEHPVTASSGQGCPHTQHGDSACWLDDTTGVLVRMPTAFSVRLSDEASIILRLAPVEALPWWWRQCDLIIPLHVHSGTMGLKGDLTAGEIVEQLVHARRVTTIKNVVYMVSLPPSFHLFSIYLRAAPSTRH